MKQTLVSHGTIYENAIKTNASHEYHVEKNGGKHAIETIFCMIVSHFNCIFHYMHNRVAHQSTYTIHAENVFVCVG